MSKRKHLEVQTVQKSWREYVTRTEARKILKCRASETVNILKTYKVGLLYATFARGVIFKRKEVEAVAAIRAEARKEGKK